MQLEKELNLYCLSHIPGMQGKETTRIFLEHTLKGLKRWSDMRWSLAWGRLQDAIDRLNLALVDTEAQKDTFQFLSDLIILAEHWAGLGRILARDFARDMETYTETLQYLCSWPGCSHHVLPSERKQSTCKACKISRYCSSDCQKRSQHVIPLFPQDSIPRQTLVPQSQAYMRQENDGQYWLAGFLTNR